MTKTKTPTNLITTASGEEVDLFGGGLKVNVGCGPHLAGDGWINVDVHSDEAAGITPDVVADLRDLAPFSDGAVELLYAGHCVEHVPLAAFDEAMGEIRRVLADDGLAAFVCPDVYRALDGWKAGTVSWEVVDACLEGPDSGIPDELAWEGCFHSWNVNARRLLAYVRRTFPDAVEVPMGSNFLDPFPVVSRVGWQCAVLTRSP